MNVYQVISVFKQDLNFQIQLEATFNSLRGAKNYIRLKLKCWEKIDGPRYNMLDDSCEYVASFRLNGTPVGFEDCYIKKCPVIDKKMCDLRTKELKEKQMTQSNCCGDCGKCERSLLNTCLSGTF